jgi:hypothetical protein
METLEDRRTPTTFTVNALTDDGAGAGLFGDLRYCINQANNSAGADAIVFDASTFAAPQTITLNGSQLEFTDTVGTETITGPSAGVTVSGGGSSRVFQVNNGASASFARLTISNGNTNDTGGGVLNNGTATLTNCTVSGNAATNGGGISNTGSMTATNCTIANNTANGALGGNGGGIDNSGTFDVVNSTISGNTANRFFDYYTYPVVYAGGYGAGINNGAPGTANLKNTIVSGNLRVFNNSPYGYDVDIGGTVTGSHNMTGSFAGGLVDGIDGNIISINSLMGTLGSFGGPNDTFPLLPGSPAINTGTSDGAPANDQRGLGRVGTVDIGAFESQGFVLTPVAGSSPQSTAIGTQFANPLAVVVTANNPLEPVDGGTVTFSRQTAANGASTLLLSNTSIAIDAGQAGGLTVAPNNVLGSHQVIASAGVGSPAAFNLINTGASFNQLIVNTTNATLFGGAGTLSLPLAVEFASADVIGNTAISFDKTVFKTAKTITLTGSPLVLGNTTKSMSITGPAAGVTISGGGLSRVIQVNKGGTATISKLTIASGKASQGAGMFNAGTTSLTDCNLTNNSYVSNFGGSGAGLFNTGTISLNNCSITGNSITALLSFVISGVGGAGVCNSFGGAATFTNCTITGNSITGGYEARGGGLSNVGTATLTNCTIAGNTAAGKYDSLGGGVNMGSYFDGGGTLTMTNCSVKNNIGGGVQNHGGKATLTNCNITGNTGTGVSTLGVGYAIGSPGGIYYYVFIPATTTISSCTINNNTNTGDGGGLRTGGLATVTATNCIISNNSAEDGGGVATDGFEADGGIKTGVTNLNNCTLSANSAKNDGGGVNNGPLGATSLTNVSILANSASAGGGIANAGMLKVTNSTLAVNQATTKGGGISITGGNVTLTNAALTGNKATSSGLALGGAISSEDSTVTLSNCVVAANRISGATAFGAGIYASASTVTLQSTVMAGNWAIGITMGQGGGIYSSSTLLTLLNSTVAGNIASTDHNNIFVGM